MTSSLVVLTDFYAVTNRALSYAAGLAVPLHAHLLLLHARHDELLAPADYSDSYQAWQSAQKTAVALHTLADAQPVLTEIDISEADTLTEAVREAGRHHSPLLVVLARPEPADNVELTLSTAMNLLRTAPYPLLLVPPYGWESLPPRRLLLVVDGDAFHLKPSQDVVRRLLRLASGTLTVVHVSEDGEFAPSPATVLRTVRASNLVDALSDDSLTQVYQETIVGGALQEAARQKADMLVVVARPHTLFGSLFHHSQTAQLLRESPLPVLVLPAEA